MSRTLPPPRTLDVLRAKAARLAAGLPRNPVPDATVDVVAGVRPSPADPFPDDPDARELRNDLVARRRPRTAEQRSVVDRIAKTMSLLRRCWESLETARGRCVRRARTRWDEDRTAEAEEQAARLRRSPRRTVALLLKTLQGARVLISMWNDLGARLEAGADWTARQRELGLDLLGVDPAFRDDRSPVDRPGVDAPALRKLRLDLVRENVREIELRIEGDLRESDDEDRRLLSEGRSTELDPEVRRLTAEERSLAVRLARLESRLDKLVSAAPEPHADVPAPAAAELPAASPPPPASAPASAAESETDPPSSEPIRLVRRMLERDKIRPLLTPKERAEAEELLAELKAEAEESGQAPPS